MKTPAESTHGDPAGLEAHLRAHILGQEVALDAVLPSLKIGESGLAHPGRPKASFLFLGPTGVGKTELAKTFTHYLLGKDKLLRLDMSEYQNQSALAVLLGQDRSDSGYLGQRYEEIGSRGTMILDEIEKAHPRILDLLLQLLDEARITLANGVTLDWSGYYVVLTSNIGATAVLQASCTSMATRTRVLESLARAHLRPELFARLDEVVVFRSLGFATQSRIAEKMIESERKRLARLGYPITVDAEERQGLATRGFDPKLGIRPMRRTIEQALALRVLESRR